MSLMFRKAKQNRIFQDVVDQIQAAILDGRIQAGEKLPAERELGEMMGTSRGTLREALRVLEQKGLIEIRLGVDGGAIVKGPGSKQIAESLAMLIRSQKVSLSHLAEFRKDVEGTVAGLAALRAKKKNIIRLRDLLVEMTTCWEAGVEKWSEFMRVDEKIHMLIACASGNPVYEVIVKTIHANIHIYYDRFLPGGVNEMNENYEDICNLVAAIANGQAEKATELARNHVQRFNHYMQDKKRQITPSR